MIQKTTLTFTNLLLFFSIILCTKTNSYAQTIVPQPLDGLEKLCAGTSFNEFYATFSYVNFPVGTTFTIELLDTANTPIATTFIQAFDVSATQQTIKFAVPANLVGSDTYGLRVKSSTGYTSVRFKNNLGNTSFPAYFKVYESTFSINDKTTNATICAGGNLTLSVDDGDNSPLKVVPALKFRWFKDGTIISGQSGKTLLINAEGEYFALVEYGACTESNISSNIIKVASSSSGSAVVISSSLGNPFCASTDGTVLTASSGNKYTWKKDGAPIGGNTRTLKATESGIYTVEVDFGGCSGTGSIDLKSNGFNASIDVADAVALEEGETLNVSVTTDATSPSYEWFLNNNLIAGATSNSYLVAVVGNYKVKISQASGCIATKEFAFKVTGPTPPATVIPNIVNLSGSYPYWNIPEAYRTPSTKVIIMSSNGDIMFDDVGSNYDPQVNSFIKDFKNVNPVYYYVIQSDTGEKKGSITVIK